MTKPRAEQIYTQTIPSYHFMMRCIRRAFLCGEDCSTGQNYDHRKQWIVSRFRFLSYIYALHAMSKMMHLKGNIITARNGHLSYEINSANSSFLPVLSQILQNEFGCVPIGETTAFVSEVVSDIELHGIKLGLGWDNWSGAYVMALCSEGDQHITNMANYLNKEIGKAEYSKYASM